MKWVALLSLILANFVKEPAPVVRVRSGLVRGTVSDDGRIYMYSGIPYATVDQTNRFQAPLPPPTWEGIFEARNENTRCPQRMFGPIIVGDENCLKLNIYTPVNRPPEQLLPVMVFIHGGCFFEGTGTTFLYGPDFFVEHGVILVGINYRLNVEGFLCLGIKEAPGNAGLKDQIAALKWLRENIAAFGGDPDNVTLFGESAGAVSISYLILAPLAKGLFRRAILQSGASVAPWAIQHDPIKTASKITKEFGYCGTDPHEIYNVLSNRSAEELISAIKYLKHRQYITADSLFVPCVENNIPGVDSIITEYPSDIIKSGNYSKMPIIIGYNDNESIYFVSKTHGTKIHNIEDEVDPTDFMQDDLEFPSEAIKNDTGIKILSHYLSSSKKDTIMQLVDLSSDLHIKYPMAMESSMYANTTDQPIYYYLFKYNGYINMPKFISGFMFKDGASHGDELMYLFKPYTFPLPMRYLEMQMVNRMVTLWTNFAKYGDPTPQTSPLIPIRWRASGGAVPRALVLDRRLRTAPLWDPRMVRFWTSIYDQHGRRRCGFRCPSSAPITSRHQTSRPKRCNLTNIINANVCS